MKAGVVLNPNFASYALLSKICKRTQEMSSKLWVIISAHGIFHRPNWIVLYILDRERFMGIFEEYENDTIMTE